MRGDRLHLSNIAYSVLNRNQNSIPNPKPLNLQIAQHHVPAPYAHVQILTIKALDEGAGEGVEHVSQESLEHGGKMGGSGQGDVQEKSAQECKAWMKAFLLEKAAAVAAKQGFRFLKDSRGMYFGSSFKTQNQLHYTGGTCIRVLGDAVFSLLIRYHICE